MARKASDRPVQNVSIPVLALLIGAAARAHPWEHTWQQEAGFDSFNAYRGDLAVLKASGLYTQNPATVPLASRECGLASSEIFHSLDFAPGQAVFYPVSGNTEGWRVASGRIVRA